MKQIYIVEDGHGHKKIGMSENVKQRVAQLSTSNPAGIISVMVSDFMENPRSVEKQLHDANKKYRIHGEWFKDVVDFCGIEFSYTFMNVAEGAIIVFQDSLEIIATDEDMTGQTLKVMLLLMGRLEFDNYITIKQVAIAEKLNMQKTHVSRAIKLLVDKSIILKVKEGTTTGYKLNPTYGWKGKVESMDKEKERIEKEKIIDFQSAKESRDVSAIAADDVPY